MAEPNIRKQILDKIDAADNILVTVSSNPSVDELAAALALTIAINKSDKRATAVASGKMPDALKFLRPEKTFENSVDSLRDFIIALSKDKADHLRYKLVGDHVKIFITPYRTTITEKDLQFEQGDFNVDLVIALGVKNKQNLDAALKAHGRILHDASVAIITVGQKSSELSGLNWHLPTASSLSEIALDIVNSINRDSLTKPVATALLTGIVAETDRFSNSKTSARVMTVASKLMTAGADQQLVVAKLEAAAEKASEIRIKKPDNEPMGSAAPTKQPDTMPKQPKIDPPQKVDDGSLKIIHEEADKNDDHLLDDLQPIEGAVSDEAELEESLDEIVQTPEPAMDLLDDYADDISTELIDEAPTEEASPIETEAPAESKTVSVPQVEGIVPELPIDNQIPEVDNAFISEQPIETADFQPAVPQAIGLPEVEQATPQDDTYIRSETAEKMSNVPSIGGTLNATTEQAAEDRRREEENQRNQTILSHGTPGVHDQTTAEPAYSPEIEAQQPQPTVYPEAQAQPTNQMAASPVYEQPAQPLDDYAISAQSPQELAQPAVDLGGLPLPPPVPDFSNMPLPPEFTAPPNFGPQDFTQPDPVQFDTVQPAEFSPAPDVAQGTNASGSSVMTEAVYPNDPSQFQIPGM